MDTRDVLRSLALLVVATAPARAGEAPLWPDLSEPPRVGGGGGDAAVIVAIEDYNTLTDIPGSRLNALDWYSYLTEGRGIPAAQVTLLTDNAATRESVASAMARAVEAAPPGGTFWFVFIGHGAPSRDGKDGVLVGWDTQQTAESVYARGIAQSEVLALLDRGRQAASIAIVDACFSGMTSRTEGLVGGLMPVIPVDALPSTRKTTVLSAGTSDQFAGPLPGAARPAFSYLALGAVHGWGDGDGDGRVTAAEVQAYTSGALRALPLGRAQTPTLAGDGTRMLGAGRSAGPNLANIRRALEPPSTGAANVPLASADRPASGVSAREYALAEDGAALLKAALAHRTREEIRAAAEAGDGESMYLMALASWDGTTGDLASYVQWCRRASARGFVRAQAAFGVRLFYGEGVPRNQSEGLQWLEIAADGGSPWAMQVLGEAYAGGIGVAADPTKAEAWFRRGHDAGYPASTVSLARSLLDRAGARRAAGDASGARVLGDEALGYLRTAAEAGSGPASGELARLSYEGSWVARDTTKAVSLYAQAASRGDWSSAVELVRIYLNQDEDRILPSRDPARAAAVLRPFVDAGEVPAMIHLGDLIQAGDVPGRSAREGLELWERAASKGSVEAASRLMSAYWTGDGAPKDVARAVAYGEAVVRGAEAAAPYTEDAWPVYPARAAHVLIEAYGSGAVPAPGPGRVEELRARWGHGPMARFTVPLECGTEASTGDVYLWDWDRAETPVHAQSAWLVEARGCPVKADTLASFQKLQALARERKLSFVELSEYALEAAKASK